ncbi:hypothetical protein Q5Y75_23970 [Ruegeria sp. 2205SS24-7]|uniref:hypothetical protein n=1 Tax=Ruegeria discodermiae TaxID=3064389 RepID=UPI0027415742|nr:hypothetical protein [Ruegeria sp. 2205SS24-7]MDP5220252.1 hypothetical protein [Ruegeria sp. 2205SS24-7]
MTKDKDSFQAYLHGYDFKEFDDIEEHYGLTEEIEPSDWTKEFEKQCDLFHLVLTLRDPYSVLARSASQSLVENTGSKTGVPVVQLPTVELLQASLLMNDPTRTRVAPSPGTFVRLWKNGDRMLRAFVKKQTAGSAGDEDVFRELAHRSKVQTLHYRFNFDRAACLLMVSKIASIFDEKTKNAHRLKVKYGALVQLLDQCGERLSEHYQHVDDIQKAKSKEQVENSIAFFIDKCSLADHLWAKLDKTNISFEIYQYLAFQLAEIAHEWIYTFKQEDLSEEEREMLSVLSLKPGELSECKFEYMFMNNPTWSKPFVETPCGNYFTAIPQAAIAFPFSIIQSLLPDDKVTQELFSASRSEALEEIVFETIKEAMPSADVYSSVLWKDPDSGVTFENDVIAILGNQLFVFEAKSGKIAEAAKRGAKKSLKLSLDTLFVEPARQSERLQRYLNRNPKNAHLVEKKTGKEVRVDLSKPKAVYRFGITMESLASLTAGRRYFEGIGLIDAATPWAPSLSIGELRMLSKYLDSEVSFGHYLSRRYSIEELISFIGDEQDLLSMYLTNGFCVLGDDTKEKALMFLDSDAMVRTNKVPRQDRSNVDIAGVHLPPRWKRIAEEVYAGHPSIDRHKFDILFTLMNQPPPSSIYLQKRVSRWRSGAGGKQKTGEHSKYVIGKRQYIVLLNLISENEFHDPESLTHHCRAMALHVCEDFHGTSDCLVLTFAKRSRSQNYDGVSFFRLLPPSSSIRGPII